MSEIFSLDIGYKHMALSSTSDFKKFKIYLFEFDNKLSFVEKIKIMKYKLEEIFDKITP